MAGVDSSKTSACWLICSYCGESRPESAFHLSVTIRRGRVYGCRTCLAKRKKDERRAKRPLPVVQMTSEQAAYLAGLIDGEGCISISRIKSSSPRGYGYFCRMSIGMTDPLLLEIAREIGIGVQRLQTGGREKKWKDCYIWYWSGNGVRILLPLVSPYLRFKRRQAEVALEYLQLADHHSLKGVESSAYWVRADWLHREMKQLNRRGRKQESLFD
jgi:LAGLIDADG DNA endonuclease family protein